MGVQVLSLHCINYDAITDEGISGTSLKNRDEFNAMIAACRNGEYDLIVTKSVSRFARNLVDCISLIRMLKGLNPPVGVFFETDNLKSLTRYRFDKVKERGQLRQSVSRLVCILFPELEKLVSTLHLASVYALLDEFPGAKQIAGANLTHLKTLLQDVSNGRYGRDKAMEIREAARTSIGSVLPVKSLELQHTIRLIRELDAEINEIEAAIEGIMDQLHSPITTIPGIGTRMGAMILAEVGDFYRFESPDKLLAYAGLSPSTYQSGQLNNCHAHMEKRGSRYLRYAIFNAAKYVCLFDSTFATYLAKKRAEGKHYNVAITHVAKKLVRLIFALERSGQAYHTAA
jgi:transposase